MRIFTKQIDIEDSDGFTDVNNILKRKAFGDRLMSFMLIKDNIARFRLDW